LSERSYIGSPVKFPLTALSRDIGNRSHALLYFKPSEETLKHILGKRNEIVFLAFDEQRNIVGIKGREIDNPELWQKEIFAYTIMPLYPGRFSGRVVIRNLETGKGAIGSASIVILDTLQKVLHMHSPLVLVPSANIHYIHADHEERKDREENDALLRVYPFDPNQYSPLLGKARRGVSEIMILVPYSVFGIPEERIKLYASCVDQKTGEKIPAVFSYNKRDGVFFLKLQTDKLGPGTYFVYVFAEEIHTQLKAHTRTQFSILH